MGAWPKFSVYSGSSAFKESLPTAEDNNQNATDATDPILPWIKSKTAELDVINITSALIAAVISGAFSWPTINAAPWTSKACFYAALVLSLTAIFSGSQQSIALHRIGGKTATRLRQHMWNRKDKEFVAYIWQLPVMMLNISIWLLLVGLLILIWDRAASSGIWGGDTKIAFVATLASIFALANYAVGTIFIWRMKSALYSEPV